jgi:hypothetical protein
LTFSEKVLSFHQPEFFTGISYFKECAMRKHIFTTEVEKPPNDDVEPPGSMSMAFELSLVKPIPPVCKSPPFSNVIAGQSVLSFPINEKAKAFKERFFPHVSDKVE